MSEVDDVLSRLTPIERTRVRTSNERVVTALENIAKELAEQTKWLRDIADQLNQHRRRL